METLRTRLRRLCAEDFNNMRVLDSDAAVVRFTPARIPLSEAQTRERIESQMEKQSGFEPFGIWIAEEKQTGTFVGWFMLIPSQGKELELGFMLSQAQWGKGFATEISKGLIDFAVSKGINKLSARTSHENVASIRVLEKLGFQHIKNVSVIEKGFEDEPVELKFYELIC